MAEQPASSAVPQGSDASAVSGATPGAATPTGKPAKATAQSEAGEPRADTSSPANPSETPDRSATTSPAAGRPPAAAAAPSSGRPTAGAARASADHAAAGSGSGQKSASKVDKLELGTATVTGDREQPKILYIVPWKKSDIGDLAGKPMNSLVDEILAPVDRDVFKREVVYYHAVQTDASQNGAAPKPAPQGEK
jgi:hypothetical protein